MLSIIGIILLLAPLLQEISDDRFGDSDHKPDVYRRVVIAILAGFANSLLHLTTHWLFILKSVVLSLAMHFMVFDYAINIVLGIVDWFSYLSNSPKGSEIDKIPVWNRIGPWGRFAVRLTVLGSAILFYIS